MLEKGGDKEEATCTLFETFINQCGETWTQCHSEEDIRYNYTSSYNFQSSVEKHGHNATQKKISGIITLIVIIFSLLKRNMDTMPLRRRYQV